MGRILEFLLLALAAILLILGVMLPIMRFEQLYFFSHEPSLLQLVAGLWSEGDWVLSVLVATFSIVFPGMKLVVIAAGELGHRRGRSALFRRAMPHLTRWSMMDVMLVAIVIFAAKTSGFATAAALPGLWCYAASAIMTAILPAVVRRGRMERQIATRQTQNGPRVKRGTGSSAGIDDA